MNWIKVGGKYLNLDLATRIEVQQKEGGTVAILHFGKDDVETLRSEYADAFVAHLEKSSQAIGPDGKSPGGKLKQVR